MTSRNNNKPPVKKLSYPKTPNVQTTCFLREFSRNKSVPGGTLVEMSPNCSAICQFLSYGNYFIPYSLQLNPMAQIVPLDEGGWFAGVLPRFIKNCIRLRVVPLLNPFPNNETPISNKPLIEGHFLSKKTFTTDSLELRNQLSLDRNMEINGFLG